MNENDRQFNPEKPEIEGSSGRDIEGETPKVQPKKETVRISLPPKPKSAPTIKIPRPQAPPAEPTPPPTTTQSPEAVKSTPIMSQPEVQPSASSASTIPPSSSSAPSKPRPVIVGQPSTAELPITSIDMGLAIAAAVLALIVALRLVILPGGF